MMKIIVWYQSEDSSECTSDTFEDVFDHSIDDRGNLHINTKTRTRASYAEGIWKIVYTFILGEKE